MPSHLGSHHSCVVKDSGPTACVAPTHRPFFFSPPLFLFFLFTAPCSLPSSFPRRVGPHSLIALARTTVLSRGAKEASEPGWCKRRNPSVCVCASADLRQLPLFACPARSRSELALLRDLLRIMKLYERERVPPHERTVRARATRFDFVPLFLFLFPLTRSTRSSYAPYARLLFALACQPVRDSTAIAVEALVANELLAGNFTRCLLSTEIPERARGREREKGGRDRVVYRSCLGSFVGQRARIVYLRNCDRQNVNRRNLSTRPFGNCFKFVLRCLAVRACEKRRAWVMSSFAGTEVRIRVICAIGRNVCG